MDWNDLPVLLAIARSSSLTEAAVLLGVNQTTVTRRLEALETATGSRLVERSKQGVSLTASGEGALAAVEQMEGLALELERSLLGGDARLSGSLRVTTTDTIAVYDAALFTSFSERYPEVELQVATGYRQQSLSRRQADVALRWSNRPEPHLLGRKLVRVDYALYGAQCLVARVGRRAALKKFPWIAWDPGSGARVTDAWVQKEVPEARVLCRYDSALAMHAAVKSGAAVAFMPCAYAERTEGLVRLRPVEKSFSYDIWSLTHPDLANTARVRAFMSHAGEYFEGERARFEVLR